MELSERKQKILKAIVDLYIRSAEPVGSKTIAALPDMNFSSATIRNEMAELTTRRPGASRAPRATASTSTV